MTKGREALALQRHDSAVRRLGTSVRLEPVNLTTRHDVRRAAGIGHTPRDV